MPLSIGGNQILSAVTTEDTPRDTDIIPSNDPFLFLPLTALAVYQIELFCQINIGAGSPGFRWNWTFPTLVAAAAANYNIYSLQEFPNLAFGATISLGSTFGDQVDLALTAGLSVTNFHMIGVISPEEAGLINFQWSQFLSVGTPTTLVQGAVLTATQVG